MNRGGRMLLLAVLIIGAVQPSFSTQNSKNDSCDECRWPWPKTCDSKCKTMTGVVTFKSESELTATDHGKSTTVKLGQGTKLTGNIAEGANVRVFYKLEDGTKHATAIVESKRP